MIKGAFLLLLSFIYVTGIYRHRIITVCGELRTGAMRVLSTRVHGFLDYTIGLLLIAAPWLLGFNHDGYETSVPVGVGTSILIYNIFTDYEVGLVKRLPMRMHLVLDALISAFLAASPWLFGFVGIVYTPHLFTGILLLIAVLITRTTPYTDNIPVQRISQEQYTYPQVHDA